MSKGITMRKEGRVHCGKVHVRLHTLYLSLFFPINQLFYFKMIESSTAYWTWSISSKTSIFSSNRKYRTASSFTSVEVGLWNSTQTHSRLVETLSQYYRNSEGTDDSAFDFSFQFSVTYSSHHSVAQCFYVKAFVKQNGEYPHIETATSALCSLYAHYYQS